MRFCINLPAQSTPGLAHRKWGRSRGATDRELTPSHGRNQDTGARETWADHNTGPHQSPRLVLPSLSLGFPKCSGCQTRIRKPRSDSASHTQAPPGSTEEMGAQGGWAASPNHQPATPGPPQSPHNWVWSRGLPAGPDLRKCPALPGPQCPRVKSRLRIELDLW